jgi:GNAT superfamily N-acetyltransferase
MKVEKASVVTEELRHLWDQASKRLLNHRGGEALYASIRGDVAPPDLLEVLTARGYVWIVESKERLLGFAVVREQIVEGIFIDHHSRRQKVATKFLQSLVDEAFARDGFALPGDRAMKSLYESFGWKARLLTMRGV